MFLSSVSSNIPIGNWIFRFSSLFVLKKLLKSWGRNCLYCLKSLTVVANCNGFFLVPIFERITSLLIFLQIYFLWKLITTGSNVSSLKSFGRKFSPSVSKFSKEWSLYFFSKALDRLNFNYFRSYLEREMFIFKSAYANIHSLCSKGKSIRNVREFLGFSYHEFSGLLCFFWVYWSIVSVLLVPKWFKSPDIFLVACV